ncbi:hypothetical protein CGS27_17335, partial [Enterobacter cloacae]
LYAGAATRIARVQSFQRNEISVQRESGRRVYCQKFIWRMIVTFITSNLRFQTVSSDKLNPRCQTARVFFWIGFCVTRSINDME